MSRLPNFFLVGAAKAGTSSLHAYLGQHPQVFMCAPKEPSFFALEGEPQPWFFRTDGTAVPVNTIHDLADYRALFGDTSDARIVGDASTLYLFDAKAPRRLREHVPHAKIAAVLRHPVDRAYSHYLYFRFRGHETMESFTDAFWAEDDRIGRKLGAIWSYRRMGFYAEQLARYRELFPEDQLKVYLYEDWRTDPSGVMVDLFRFLELDDGFVPDMTVRHRAGGIPRSSGLRRAMERENGLARRLARAVVPPTLRPRIESLVDGWNAVRPPLDPAVRRELTKVYRDDIVALQAMLGRDLSTWLDS